MEIFIKLICIIMLYGFNIVVFTKLLTVHDEVLENLVVGASGLVNIAFVALLIGALHSYMDVRTIILCGLIGGGTVYLTSMGAVIKFEKYLTTRRP